MMFLPNFGLTNETPFGVLEISDFLILPFLFSLGIAPSSHSQQHISRINKVLLVFLAWALLSTLLIPVQFESADHLILVNSLLKLVKASLYAVAGVLISRKLRDSRVQAQWLWSLIAALLVLSTGQLMTAGTKAEALGEALHGYKGYNLVSVAIGIICSYLTGLWFDQPGHRKWRFAAVAAMVVSLFSAAWSAGLRSHGRGGWIALFLGLLYVLVVRCNRLKAIGIASFGIATVLVSYCAVPNFRNLVDITIPGLSGGVTPLELADVDDGSRTRIWVEEIPKLLDSPFLGTGFFNRSFASGLEPTGSHNFFIQMFLETGLVGGFCILAIFGEMWRLAGVRAVRQSGTSLATRAALLSAVVGGMSGEYYYGGTALLLLFAIFAIAGSTPEVSTQ